MQRAVFGTKVRSKSVLGFKAQPPQYHLNCQKRHTEVHNASCLAAHRAQQVLVVADTTPLPYKMDYSHSNYIKLRIISTLMIVQKRNIAF